MSLLTIPVEILLQPLIDETGESIQLRSLDTCCSPVTGRDRKLHDLLHARARHPKMNCCRSFAHAAPTRETDLSIKFHD